MKPQSLIELKGVDLGYKNSNILRNVSCSINSGESVGIVGPNGSGKTTFLKGILGILKPSQGFLHLDRSQRFAYVPQIENPNLFWPLTLQDVVTLAARSKKMFGKISVEDLRFAQSAMEKVGISKIGNLLLREVSGGQKQRTALAQALCQKPNVLLLDEPTRGLDIVAERDLLSLIQRLRAEEKMTLLFVTHSLQIPLNFMEKILLFDKGTIITTTPKELVETKKLEEIYGIPFLHHEQDGIKWVMPLGKKC